MRAYGQTSDASSGFLRDSLGCGSPTTGTTICSHEEFGWHEPEQETVEFAPIVKGKPFKDADRVATLTGPGLSPRRLG